MKKLFLSLCLLLNCSLILHPAYSSKNELKIKTGYYVANFKPLSMLHVYVPSDYSPDKKYPFLLCLHRPEGNGEEFMNILQDGLKPYKVIIACPDSENHYTWGTEKKIVKHKKNSTQGLPSMPTSTPYKRNVSLLKRSFRYIHSRYSIDPQKTFLLGQGGTGNEIWKTGGAHFLLYLILNKEEPGFMKKFSAFVISGSEAQYVIEHNHSKLNTALGIPQGKNLQPILYLQSREDPQSPFLAARYTRDQLRKAGYPVNYIEGADWEGFPITYTPIIMSWLLNEPKIFRDDIAPESFGDPVTPTEELSIQWSRPMRKSVNSDFSSPFVDTFTVRLEALKDINQKDQKKDFKEKNTDIEVVFKAYNENKENVHYDIFRFTGLEPGEKALSEYRLKNYGQVPQKTDAELDQIKTFFSSRKATINFNLPKGKKYHYASFQAFKSGHLAAFSIFPRGTDHREFKDLAHINLPAKKEVTDKEKADNKQELKPLSQKTN